ADGQGVGPASAVDLERGMTSPWQGPGDAEGDAATAAVATTVEVAPPPGLTDVGRAPEAVGAGAVSGGGGGVLGKEKRGGPAARPEGLTGAPERGQGVPQRQRRPLQQQQKQQQRAKIEGLAQGQVVSASPMTAEPLAQQASVPVCPSPTTGTSDAAIDNREVSTGRVGSVSGGTKAGTSGKGGNGRSRA
ncbi:unnamed protein product, partial [Ectocarpus sp. 4 AP-2014]